jgi:uncharacterized Zn-binding protein involved in type VI secretion
MAGRAIIVRGDTTTHGGRVISAVGRETPTYIRGKPVACIGDEVWCPKCKGGHYITANPGTGNPTAMVNGREVALEGARVSDGSLLISVCQSVASVDDGGGAVRVVQAQSSAGATGTAGTGLAAAGAPARKPLKKGADLMDAAPQRYPPESPDASAVVGSRGVYVAVPGCEAGKRSRPRAHLFG